MIFAMPPLVNQYGAMIIPAYHQWVVIYPSGRGMIVLWCVN